jgi:hypothetical protein
MPDQSTMPTNDGRCPCSGEPIGRIIEYPGTDEWDIECPTCGTWWAGGSTILDEHDRPR